MNDSTQNKSSSDVKVLMVRHVAYAEIKSAIAEGVTDLADLFRRAVPVARGHFMAPNDDEAFRGALEALYLLVGPDNQERILEEARNLKALSAALEGVPIDLDGLVAPENPIGLLRIYREVVDA